jgi:cytochrome c peroxidase
MRRSSTFPLRLISAGSQRVKDASSRRSFICKRLQASFSVRKALLDGVIAVWFLVPFSALAADDSQEAIIPIPMSNNLDERKVELGKALFSDSRLSDVNGVSCSSCHQMRNGMADGSAKSHGLPGAPGLVNTPSLFNVGLNSLFNWSGQTKSLHEQASNVIEMQNAMGAKWPVILDNLNKDQALSAKFQAIYGEKIGKDNIVDALVEFEKSLNTPNSPFDRYLRGKKDAISEQAQTGYEQFKNYGCISCHQGVNIGGNMLQIFGIFGTPAAASKGDRTEGAAKSTGIGDEQPVFRVPSLRNVAETAPYFHDGSAKTLSEAINIMGKYQLGRNLSGDEIANLEAFLRSLTGEYQGIPVSEQTGTR